MNNNQKRIIGWRDIKTKEEKEIFCKALTVYICNSFYDFFGIEKKVKFEDITIPTTKEKNHEE